jgi:hypothetical protein
MHMLRKRRVRWLPNSHVTYERRKRKRVALHWPVCLFRQPATQSVWSVTDNLSSDGFYCVSRESFQPGERLKCLIVIRGGGLGGVESAARLACHVTVIRVEDLYNGFGLGCHIDDYALIFNGSQFSPRSEGAFSD